MYKRLVKRAAELYRWFYGFEPTEYDPLPPSGGERFYMRVSLCPGSPTAIAALVDDSREYRAYVNLSEDFMALGLPVPDLYEKDGRCAYLVEDLGGEHLIDLYRDDATLLPRAMEMLRRFHDVPVERVRLEYEPMEQGQTLRDLNYFKYCFLKPAGVRFDEEALDRDFRTFAGRMLHCQPQGLMLRDFQSRNIMVKDGELRLIDFQGARRGPVLYDVASLLWQARLELNDEQRRRLLSDYGGTAADWEPLTQAALFRLMQVMGAYGFRGMIQGRNSFVTPLRRGIESLCALAYDLHDLPALRDAILSAPRFAEEHGGGLRVDVTSFGFHFSGPPRQFDSDGGGYVFDCRALPNPARIAELKPLTGMDEPVRRYLESQKSVKQFVKHAMGMVEPHAENFLSRGFDHLTVAFGCTGGRHRSVYCAERLAREIKARFPATRVTVSHRELGINQRPVV